MEYEGERFVINKRRVGITYYQCAQKRSLLCRGRIKVDGHGLITMLHPHNGHGQIVDVTRRLREACVRRAVQERTSLRSIYDEEAARDPEAAQRYTFATAQQTMSSARHRRNPPIPATLRELGNLLSDPNRQDMYYCLIDNIREPFYRTTVEVNGSSSLLFASQRLLDRAVAGVEELHLDGTFKCVPRRPPAHQLLTVHVAIGNKTIPIAYALMENRRQEIYVAVLQRLRGLAPTLEPINIMCDYEPALRRALEVTFPDSNILGCYFHFANAVWKKAAALGLIPLIYNDDDVRRAIKMLMALPLLPMEFIEDGLQLIQNWSAEHQLQFDALFAYMQRYWIQVVGPAGFCVYGLPRRTNNNVEAFNKTLLLRMNVHPNVFVFLALGRGLRIARPTAGRWLANDLRIREAQEMLARGDYNVMQFLHRVSHSIDNVERNLHEAQALRHLDDLFEENIAEMPPGPVEVPVELPAALHLEALPVVPAPAHVPAPPVHHVQLELIDDQPQPQHPLPVAPQQQPEPVPAQDYHCSVCIGPPPTHACVPCGHRCMCQLCAQQVGRRGLRCPVCRDEIETIIHIFLV